MGLGSLGFPSVPPEQARPLAADAPLLEAFVAATRDSGTPFSVPGHKHRARVLDADLGLAADPDIPLYGGLDTMKLTGGNLAKAEALAARRWQADWCRFSVGGATQANQALLLAAGGDGDQIVMARSVHRSVFSGLVLAGLRPVWLPPRADPASTLPLGPTPDQVATALEAAPGAVAVWITEPSYLGTVADVGALAAVAHARGVPLLVDQAWGAHLGFHPGYPPHALQAGADANITRADNDAFDTALTAAGVEHEVVTYEGAPHSFFDRKAAEFADASADAWTRVQGFIAGFQPVTV